MDQDQIILASRPGRAAGTTAVAEAMTETRGGLSLQQLADMTGLTKPTCQKVRAGAGIRLTWAFRIADILDRPPSALFQFRNGRPL